MRLSRDSVPLPHFFLLCWVSGYVIKSEILLESETEKRNDLSGGGARTHHQTKKILPFFFF